MIMVIMIAIRMLKLMMNAIAIRGNTNKDYHKEKDEVHNDNYDDAKIVDYDGNDDDVNDNNENCRK